jgi:hypothetical protein
MTSESLRFDSRRRRILLSAVAIVVLLLLLLLLRCPKAVGPPFDYFRAKAEELGRDPARVESFVRDGVRTLSYQGNVKGPLGALWHGGGSSEEKEALAAAILAHCGRPAPSPAAAALRLRVLHRRLLAGGVSDQPVYDGPIHALIGDVHSIVADGAGRWSYHIRVAGSSPTAVASAERLVGEEVHFSVDRPGGPEPLTLVRELWREDNRIGPRAVRAGDRHDLVVLPCRVSPYVREKEELILRQRGRRDALEAAPYLALLDYAMNVDRLLEKLERDLKVAACFEHPRLLIWSSFRLPALPTPAVALDLRLNRCTFEGAPGDAYLAAQVRSLVESGLEHHFLGERTLRPTVSAFGVFSSLRDDYPNRVGTRLAAAREAAAALSNFAGADGEARFRARGASGPSLAASRVPGGLRLRGGPVSAEALSKAIPAAKPRIVDGALDHLAPNPEEAALVIEAAIMAGGAAPDYLLETDLRPGTEPLVAPGSRFLFRWGDGENLTEQAIHIDECVDDLAFDWTLRVGATPARGARRVLRGALDGARVHNPWYVMGPSEQKDATSFCVSREVHAALKAVRPVEMTLQGRGADSRAARPVEWNGEVLPLGTGTHTVPVNGRPVALRTLRARMGPSEVAVLDDPLFPVGMADRLVQVRAPVRGRVVDRQGVGVAGVKVEFDGAAVATTWVDGRFRMAAGRPRKITLGIRSRGAVIGEVEIDTASVGLEEQVIVVDRPRTELVWVGPGSVEKLDALPLSAQARRHARRYVESRQLVVVPNREVDLGELSTVGFYAFDPPTGTFVGVTEDGLHGATAAAEEAWRSALESAAKDLKGAAEEVHKGEGGPAHLHMLRGAIAAWWIYSAYRIESAHHGQAVVRLLNDMDYWAEETNILSGVEKVGGKKLREKAGEVLGDTAIGDPDSDLAAAAFKIGYLGSTLFLGNRLGGE